MKREIKFRAWDSVNEKWLWPYPDGFSVIGEVTVFDLLKQQTPEPDIYGGIEICQFTGLHDKNGQEIYEGDIIQMKDEFNTKYNRLVVYVNQSGRYHLEKTLYENIREAITDIAGRNRAEIIGNIYENPELLK